MRISEFLAKYLAIAPRNKDGSIPLTGNSGWKKNNLTPAEQQWIADMLSLTRLMEENGWDRKIVQI